MLFLNTLFATVPTTLEWSPTVGLTMIICNIIAIAFAKFTVKYPSADPQLPSGEFFGGFGLPGLLATTSFGHLLGAGVILGLSNLGAL
ncbi:photosystem I reaction center subunit PsaK [Geminocystis sp. NIES-3709]|uniref:photosystem I reaction center subunit PsaK n=1 Tax=Geminocystis sp. NIES-3709 TaxID=1617448 RepID=UPI0005FC6803|nr:photosystem I reaction center subunit PsaK [Geminocystis sp. NIES-3709]BAQ63356.1 photosystem I subunit X (PsaK [Geminocystis sp. NIES-3709]